MHSVGSIKQKEIKGTFLAMHNVTQGALITRAHNKSVQRKNLVLMEVWAHNIKGKFAPN